MNRQPDQGVSLLNVLVVVAAASGLVHIMLEGQQSGVVQISQAQEIAQAEALARAGVTSVAVALRRDLLEAPETDHMQEAWAQAAQDGLDFEFGRFEVEIEDMRGRFNLNSLAAGAFSEQRVFQGLLAALDLPEALVSQIIRSLQDQGGLDRPIDLVARGFSAADVARLGPHVAALDAPGPINLNTATEPVLAALFANPAAARLLVARRAANGQLTKQDLSALGLIPPPLAGFTSDRFDVRARAEVGNARRQVDRRILRDADAGQVTILPSN